MSRFGGFGVAGMTALALVLTGTVAEARDGRTQREPTARSQPQPAAAKAPAVTAKTEAPATPAEKVEVGQAAAEKIVQVAPCARKVKVIYSGYGEGDRASCMTGGEQTR